MELNDLFLEAKEKNASDLHICVGLPPMLRLHGSLVKTSYPVITPEESDRLAESVLTEKYKKEYQEKLSVDFSVDIKDISRFRANIYKENKGTAMAFRIIPSTIISLADLGMPPVLGDVALKEKGLILVTGPTGSGKSTTLAAMIDLVNKQRSRHIITIEDPIEFIHPHQQCVVNQREIGTHASSFSDALRGALRQDPDVLLVGELRDLETIAMALTAAETGHLVFATLHTNDCASTVDRIIDVFPSHQQNQAKMQLASTLNAVVSQILVPKKDGSGRICVPEIMIGTNAILSLVREGKSHQIASIIQTSTKDGMQTMDSVLKNLVAQGVIDKEEAISRTKHVEDIRELRVEDEDDHEKGKSKDFRDKFFK